MRIRAATPTRDDFASALKAPVRRGKKGWSIPVVDPKLSPAENQRRLNVTNEMMRERRRLQTERSERRAAELDSTGVLVRGPQGDVRRIPAHLEGAAAAKPGFRPAPRRRWTTRTVWHEDGTYTEYHRDGEVKRGVWREDA